MKNTMRLWSVLLVGTLTAAIRGEEPLAPAALEYEGAFACPAWTPGVRWGSGLKGLGVDPGSGYLIGTSHPTPGPGVLGKQVAALEIPEARETDPALPNAERLELLVRAKQKSTWVDIVAGQRADLEEHGLDSWGGLAILEGRIHWSWFRFYATQPLDQIDDPTFGVSALDGSLSEGLGKAGPYGDPVFHQKRTSGYLAAIPAPWAARHVGGKRLLAGKGDGPGTAGNSHGPALLAVDHRAPAVGGAVLPAQSLAHFAPGTGQIRLWSACDRWTALTWLPGAIVVLGRRGTAANDCYGTPEDCNSPCGGTSKGNHCHPYWAELQFFDPARLARSAAGEISPEEVRPYASRRLEEFWDRCDAETSGMAYDPQTRRLYVAQANQENPIVHVFSVAGGSTPEEPDLPPKPPVHLVEVVIDGRSQVYTGRSLLEALARAQVALDARYRLEAFSPRRER